MAAISSMISGAAGGAGNLGTLYIKIAADVSGLDKGMRDAEKMILGSTTGIKNAALIAGAAIVGLATAAVAEFGKFEYSFANVRKTVQATEEEFKQFEATFRKMAMQMPTNVNEINNIAAAAGQLGIQKDAIVGFTKVMIDLGNTTNLKGEAAAQQLARLANITGMSQKDFDRLGSTISELDRRSATTAAEIVTLSLRIAGAGKTIGMSEADILSFSAALSSVGIGAEAGGTAISQTMIEIAKAVSTGSKELQVFAQVAGMSAAQFKELFQKDASEALLQFIEGLKRIEEVGGEAFHTLDQLGMDGARITRTLISAAEAGDLFRNLLVQGNAAWKENSSLTQMAEERYKTLFAQLTITWNRFKDLLITIGENMAPAIKDLNHWLQECSDQHGELAENVSFISQKIVPAAILSINLMKLAYQGFKLFLGEFLIMSMQQWNVYLAGIVKVAAGVQKAVNFITDAYNKTHPFANVPKLSFADDLKANAEGFGAGITDLQQQMGKLATDIDKTKTTITSSWEKMLAPVQSLNKEISTTVHDTFELSGFLQGVGTSAEKAATGLGAAADKAAKLAATAKQVASSKMHEALDQMGVPSPRNEFGLNRGERRPMSQAEMHLGAMSGIPGMDTGSQQMLQIQQEMEMNRTKVEELRRLGDLEGEITEETQKRKLQALEMYNERARQLQMAQAQMMAASFTSIGESMLSIGGAFFGKQTAMYKAMFAASKAFAIAESTVKIMQGIASAAALPWPANLGAIASVIAATANIISTIQSVKLEFGGERAKGGAVVPGKAYLVGEKGPEMFSPSGAGAIIPNDRMMGSGVMVNVHNYADAKVEVKQRDDGDKRIIDLVIRRVEGKLASDFADGTGALPKALERNYNVRRGGQQ